MGWAVVVVGEHEEILLVAPMLEQMVNPKYKYHIQGGSK